MFKIILPLLAIFVLANASDYSRANSASAEALRGLDCEFEDCTPVAPPPPKIIVKEKVIYKDRPVIVEKEKVIYRDRPIIIQKEKVIYRDREVQRATKPVHQSQKRESKRLYNKTFDIPVIGVVGSSFYTRTEHFHIEDDKVKARNISYNSYLKSQSRPAWASMRLKNGKELFLNKYDGTIPYYRESMTQISFHVELPREVISNDTTIVALPKKSFKNTSGNVEEFATCSFNDFVPNDSKLQSIVSLNGKDYLDVKCTVVLYNYNTQGNENNEIQNMIQSDSFSFIPVYRVFPDTRKGSKKAVLGNTLKKFVYARELDN